MSLNWDGIDHFTEEGIVTKTGEEYKFDIIIFATGFEIVGDSRANNGASANSPKLRHHINLIGINGQTLKEYWDKEGGPTAYLGTTMPGFPNFFSILGEHAKKLKCFPHSDSSHLYRPQYDYGTRLGHLY